MDIVIVQPWQIFFVGVLLAGEAVLTWRRPQWGAVAVVALLPTYIFRIRDIAPLPPTNVLELLFVTFVAAAVIHVLARRGHFTSIPRSFWMPLSLVLAGATISALRGMYLVQWDPETVRLILGSLKGFVVEPVLFILVLMSIMRTHERTGRGETSASSVLRAYVWSAVAVAGIALAGGIVSLFSISYPVSFGGFVTFDGRLRGFYLSPNHLAMYILPAIVLLVGRLKSEIRNPKRWLSGAILLAALIWTQSAGAIIGLGAGLVFLLVAKRRPGALRRVGHLGLVIGISLGILVPLLIGHFSPALFSADYRSSFASRGMVWRAAGEMLSEHWLLGIGPGAFQYHYLALQEKFPPYLEWAVPQPHNLFLAFWLQTGVLGLIGFVWLLVQAFKVQRSRFNVQTIATSAALVAILVHGFVDTPFFKNDLAVLFGLLSVVIFAQKNPHKASQSKDSF